jgi:hypothetical protein
VTAQGRPSRLPGEGAVLGLRANCLAALVMLVVESCLGIVVSSTVRAPSGASVRGLPAQLLALFTRGPLPLSLHAALGALLLASGAAALVRALALRRPRLVALASVGVLAVGAAAAFGARSLGGSSTAASVAMASSGGLAILAYALLLFLLPAAGKQPSPSI